MNILQKIIIIALVVIVGAGSAFGIMKASDYKLDYNKNTNIADDYVDLKKLNDIMSKSDEKKETNIEISNFTLHNNQKFVKLDEFIELSGVIEKDGVLEYEGFKCNLEDAKAILNNEEYYSLDYLTNNLGYTETEVGTDKVELKRNYELKRIIAKDELDIDNATIKNKIKIRNLYLYDLQTEYDAKLLQEQLQEDGIENVTDSFISIADDEMEALIYDSDADMVGGKPLPEFYSWGGDSMHFADYFETLKDYENKRNVAVIIDSGINPNHELVKNNFLAKYSKSICAGYNSSDYIDDKGHGTHVAGTVLELTGGRTDVIAVKVLNRDGQGASASSYAALVYALSLARANVPIASINMSIGSEIENVEEWTNSFLYKEYCSLISDLKNEGVIVCVSAGNKSQDTKHQRLASVTNVIVVSAIDSNNNLASFSNRGNLVTFCAPGKDIKSADFEKENGYCSKSGTSMAAPHLTAVAALASLICDNYTYEDKLQIMKSSVDDLGATGKDDNFGYGCINMSKLKAYISQNTFDKSSISAVDNLGNIASSKTIKLCYINENFDYKEISYKNLNSLEGKTYYGKFKITADKGEDFLSWRGAKSNDFSKSVYLSDSKSYWFSPDAQTQYFYIVYETKFIKAEINFNYVDKPQYTGFASYANTTLLTYVNTSGVNVVDEKYTSGFLATEQVIRVDYVEASGLTIKFKCENDSIINNIAIRKKYNNDLINLKAISVGAGQYELAVNEIGYSIIIDVFIFI